MNEAPKNNLENLTAKLQDSCNQVYGFKFSGDAEAVKKLVPKAELKTLEDYTEESRETLEAKWPGVCDKYDALIEELKGGNFDDERWQEILKEVWAITHPK